MPGARFHNLRDVWRHAVETFPHRAAYVDAGREYSYAECDRLSDRIRRALVERCDMAPGDRIAIAAPNGIAYMTAYWAAMKSGFVVVPVNTRLGADELRDVLANADARVLLLHAGHRPVFEELLSSCPVAHVIGVGFEAEDVLSFDALVAEGKPYDAGPDLREEDLAVIMHTSGTTGRPKGAMMRHGDLLFNNTVAVQAHGLRHEDVLLLAIPMYHPTAAYSLVPCAVLLGATLALAPKPDARALAELIQARRVTVFFGVPALFRLFLTLSDLDRYDLSSLRLIAYAGSAMPPETIRALRECFPKVALHNFFGLTETISMTHVLPNADAAARPDSIGKVLPGVRQRILDENGNDVPPGGVGELHFHRENVIPGYWKDPDRLARAMRGDWFNTGDLAAMDEDGYVVLKGRTKDVIIVGGENVYAAEVENCIGRIEGVREAAVVGVPATGARAHLGELVKAVVVARPGRDVAEVDVKRHCMERLASYKTPQIVEFREKLPRNAGGKIMRDLLK